MDKCVIFPCIFQYFRYFSVALQIIISIDPVVGTVCSLYAFESRYSNAKRCTLNIGPTQYANTEMMLNQYCANISCYTNIHCTCIFPSTHLQPLYRFPTFPLVCSLKQLFLFTPHLHPPIFNKFSYAMKLGYFISYFDFLIALLLLCFTGKVTQYESCGTKGFEFNFKQNE